MICRLWLKIMSRVIASMIMTACFTNACGGGETAASKAVRDAQRAVGMVLVEHGERKLLKVVVCTVRDGQLPADAALADESLCPNAFVDAEGKGYYFSELQPQGVKNRLRRHGYLKLGSMLLVPLVIGTVVGWKAKPLLKKLKLTFTAEGRVLRGGGEITAAQRKAQAEALADVRTNARVGAAGGAIAAIVFFDDLNTHLWGRGERATVKHWDDIFRTHLSFVDAEMLSQPHTITHLLTTLAQILEVSVNPAVVSA